jgi:hypothetical protein
VDRAGEPDLARHDQRASALPCLDDHEGRDDRDERAHQHHETREDGQHERLLHEV